MGKTILKKTLMRSDAVKFLETGKTGLINGFVSSRTNRAFKAFLVLGEGGKVNFEFAPRAEKPTKAKIAAAVKTKQAADKDGE